MLRVALPLLVLLSAGAAHADALPGFARCLGRTPPAVSGETFRHKRSRLMATASHPQHSLADVIAAPGEKTAVKLKLAYGRASKDLEDEKVRVFVDDCTAWQELGKNLRSNGDGVARVAFTAPGPGVYELYLRVPGDGAEARARLWVLPEGTHVVVSDIDGTLTSGDDQLVEELVARAMGEKDPPSAMPGGATLLAAHARLGHVVVYATGRPSFLTRSTREWLTAGGFPDGPIILTDSLRQCRPSAGGVGAFKIGVLKGLLKRKLVIDAAYGNADTDVLAYGKAGIATAITWIIGKHGGEGGTQAVAASWEERAKAVAAGSPVAQPFVGMP